MDEINFDMLQLLIKRKFPDIKLNHKWHLTANGHCLLCNELVTQTTNSYFSYNHFINHLKEYNLLPFI